MSESEEDKRESVPEQSSSGSLESELKIPTFGARKKAKELAQRVRELDATLD